MKKLFLTTIVILTISIFGAKAQNLVTAEIKTSAQCEDCKERIETALSYETGVKKFNVDLETKILTVTFKDNKTDLAKIKQLISKVGYDADEIAANPEAYQKLPACCKKSGTKCSD